MTTTLSIRIDRELKEDVEELLSDLGMNVTTAITCFFKKMRDVQGIPFAIGRGKGVHRAAAPAAARPPRGIQSSVRRSFTYSARSIPRWRAFPFTS